MKKIIFLVVGALLLVGASVGGTLFFTGALNPPPPVAAGAAAQEMVAAQEAPETHYYDFNPEFTVNFAGKARARFFMTEISVATLDSDVIEELEVHDPELRNDLLMLFSAQDGARISTLEGKTELRQKTLDTINAIVEKHYGKPVIKDVFFTRFVVQ